MSKYHPPPYLHYPPEIPIKFLTVQKLLLTWADERAHLSQKLIWQFEHSQICDGQRNIALKTYVVGPCMPTYHTKVYKKGHFARRP